MQSFIFIWAVAAASVGSGFQHGYNIAVLNTPQKIITDWIEDLHLSYLPTSEKRELYWSTVASMYTAGGILGGIISPFFILLMGGPRSGLIANTVLAMIAGGLMFLSRLLKDPSWLIAGRVVSGVNCGINGALCPIYLTEISPLSLRGAVGSLYQLFLTMAILIGMTLGLEPILGRVDTWQYLFLFISAVALAQMLGLMWVPESPKYLLDKKNDEEKSRKAFNKFHGHKPTAEQEYAEIKAASDASKLEPKITIKIFFSQKSYVKPLWLSIFLMIAQQMSGINAVMFYSTEIFRKTNMSLLESQLSTAAIGLINFLATIVAVAVIDRSGRKPLLVWGFIVMAASTGLLMGMLYLTDEKVWARYVCVAAILLFVVAFAVGAGPIPWFFVSEVFLTNARPIAASFIVLTNWFFNLIVALCFPSLQTLMGPLVFMIFLGFQIGSVVIIIFFIPETKNRTVEDIIKTFA